MVDGVLLNGVWGLGGHGTRLRNPGTHAINVSIYLSNVYTNLFTIIFQIKGAINEILLMRFKSYGFY